MTDGMASRSHVVDEQLTSLFEQLHRHESRFSSMEQHHAAAFERLQQRHDDSFAQLQQSDSEILALLSRLEKPTPSPPLLPLPHTPPSSFNPIPSQTNPTPLSRLPKLEVPPFTGENVLGWLFRITHFLHFHQIPDDQKITVAAFYMAGPALQWFHWLHSTTQLTSWSEFTRHLELRFGPSSFINHEAQLFKLKQTTSVSQYLTDFECLSTRVTDLSPTSLLNCFLSGLRPEIQRELYLHKPQSLHDAMGMAKLVEDKCNAGRNTFQPHRLVEIFLSGIPSLSSGPADGKPLNLFDNLLFPHSSSLSLSGMGTKVHRESYLPGYYTMRDPNEGASSGWFQYYDRTSSEHLYDGLFPKPVNGHLNHDMEIVKRTMLEHDAVFKKQVYELHRLYRIQKDLMKELKMKELTKGPVPMDASRSNSFLSQMPSEVTTHVSQMYHLPGLSNCSKGMSTTDNDDMKIPLSFLEENGSRTSPSSSVQKVNGVLVKDGESSGSKIARHPKRMIDLELPADAYIDCEDTEGVEMENIGSSIRVVNPLNKGSDLTPENDVKLTLSVGTCAKEVPNPASSNFLDTKSYIKEIQEHQDPTRSCKNFLGQDRGFFKDRHGNEGTNLNFFHANEEVRRELPLFNSEAGQSRSTGSSFSPSLCSERSLVSPLKPKKLCGNNSPDQSRREKWFGEKPTYFPENSESGPYFANSSYSRSTSQTVHPFSVPQAEYSIPPSPLVSTSRKSLNGITHIPIAVQALPCFTGSSAVVTHNRSSKSRIQNGNLGDTQDRWRNGDLKSHSTSEGQPSLYSNGFHHGSQPDSPASHLFPASFNLGKPNLKLGEDLAYGNSEFHGPQKMCNSLQLTDVKSLNAKDKVIQNGIQTQQDKAISDIEWRRAESSGVISWLGAKSPSMRTVDRKHVEYYPYASSSRNTVVPRFEWGQEKERTGISNFLDPASALAVKERRFQINEVSDDPSSKRILGFPLADQIQENILNPVPNSHEKLSLSAKSKHKQIDGCTKERNSKRRTYMSELFSGTGAGNTSKAPPENSIAIPSLLSFQSSSEKGTPVIDLEASNNLQEEDSAPSRLMGKSVQNPYSKANGSLEEDLLNDPLIRVAAENIIVLSSDTCGYVKDTTLCELPPVSCDSLHWFAEVVSSIEENVGNAGHEDDGLDSFESITLKLEEIKAEEYIQWSKPRELDNSNDGETNAASLLFTKPRRGQARRRRQKDFQKDILPGLVSLSRHEVTEDLQTIGAMMRAAGMPWPLGLSRRGTGQGRGRRRTRNTAITVVENPVSPPPKQPSSTEAEVNGAGMVGWGRRTTRQCRRQRYQSGNVALLLT